MAEINNEHTLDKKVPAKKKTECTHSEAVAAFNSGKTVLLELYDEKGKWYAGYVYNLEYRKGLDDFKFEPEEWSRAKFSISEDVIK